MKINYKIVSGVLCAVLIHDTIVGYINGKRYDQLLASNRKLRAIASARQEMLTYFAVKMDAHDVPTNDFDKIAIETILEKMD